MDKRKVKKEIESWIFSILGAILIAGLVNSKVFAKVRVQQNSMENTLLTNEQLVVDKLSYNFAEPKKGDIIIFHENKEKGTIAEDTLEMVDNIISIFNNNNDSIEKDDRLIKRVIGIPGDEIDIKDGHLYLNGKKLEESYVKGETIEREFKLPIKVPENKLFVLGDNRMISKDSRMFGLIDYKQVEGKAIYRVYPFNHVGKVK
ncbi:MULTISPECIES: signal peptidase I [Clostridium]|jgi:signal peptidase I|uniref:Signal peptidase I n=2 Tax=Clostridium TaxID=1485 RepID=A0A0D1BS51_CLOBO|nr:MULTISPECIES: signal peptidase I [Clostridium]EKS4343771.1 signal peptidase I [Clostridium botulinum]MBE6077287.1 signal peptidase I [Clostridium lundense]EKS4396341.1 signal peptidase I [Clostridium botulinum]KIS22587.1 signal peptidase [Clostridium botulinum B2 450]MCW6080690.1 signal peptidase I [Clostridium sporogenes]